MLLRITGGISVKKRNHFMGIVFLCVVSLMLFAACGNNEAEQSGTDNEPAAETYTIRIADIVSPGEPAYEALEKFKVLVEERSEGRIIVEHHGSGELGGDRATAEQVQAGMLEMCQLSSSNLYGFVPSMLALDLNFVIDNSKVDALYDAMDNGELGEFYKEKINEAGFEPIMYNTVGYRCWMTTDVPLENASSFKGAKIRTTDSDSEIAMVTALEAFATPLAIGETYTALQQGTVSGLANVPGSFYSTGMYELLTYGIDSKHNFVLQVALMNKDYYDALPEDLKEIIKDAAYEAQVYERELQSTVDDDSIQKMVDAGIQWHFLTDAERAELQEIAKSTWDGVIGDNKDIQHALDLILDSQK